MAVSQGWSEWVAGWFDEISKILPNIVATPGTSVTYRIEAEILPVAGHRARCGPAIGGIMIWKTRIYDALPPIGNRRGGFGIRFSAAAKGYKCQKLDTSRLRSGLIRPKDTKPKGFATYFRWHIPLTAEQWAALRRLSSIRSRLNSNTRAPCLSAASRARSLRV